MEPEVLEAEQFWNGEMSPCPEIARFLASLFSDISTIPNTH